MSVKVLKGVIIINNELGLDENYIKIRESCLNKLERITGL